MTIGRFSFNYFRCLSDLHICTQSDRIVVLSLITLLCMTWHGDITCTVATKDEKYRKQMNKKMFIKKYYIIVAGLAGLFRFPWSIKMIRVMVRGHTMVSNSVTISTNICYRT